MSRRGSRADQALLAVLEARGVEGVTARKLERWRQGGLIPRANRRGLGRHRGSVSVLPDGAADQVETAAKAVARYRSIDQALFVMFAQGWWVGEQALKAAYIREFQEVATWLESQAPEDGDSLTRPEVGAQAMVELAARTKEGRVWRRRLSGEKESPDSVLLSAITALLHIFQTSYPSSTDALEEALRAGGVDRLWRDQLKQVGAIVNNKSEALDDIVLMLARADFEGWVTAVEEATWEDLSKGLAAIQALAVLFKRLSEVNAAMLGDRDAFGFGVFEGLNLDDPRTIASYVPAMLLLRRNMGASWVDQRLEQILVAGDELHEAQALIAEATTEQLVQARLLANNLLITE